MSFFIASSDDIEKQDYFNGIAFSKKSIVLSLSGLKDFLNDGNSIYQLVDGRYSLSLEQHGKRYFTTDRTGQDCWFYYHHEGLWVVSNSLYAIAEKLKEKKGLVSIRRQSALFYNVRHSLGDQPCNNKTMIAGVEILPRDCFIKIEGTSLLVCKYNSYNEIANEDEYFEELHDYTENWSSRISSLLEAVKEGSVRCDLSGGIDSRIVMGLTQPKSNSSHIKYSSNKKWDKDYLIASLLCKKYNIKIDNSEISSPRSVSLDSALNIYKYGNAGIYRKNYWPKQQKPSSSIHLHGAGGENIRGLGGGSAWKIIHRLKSSFKNENHFEEFKKEYLSWFEQNGVDYRSEESSIIHYRNFRSRFHFGRNWFRSLTNPLVTPLSSLQLESMGDFLAKIGRDPKSLQFDLLYLCSDFLPFFPFDDESKKFSTEIIEKSFRYVDKVKCKNVVESMRIYGEHGEEETKAGSSITDKDINEAVLNEVNDFVKHSDGKYIGIFPSLGLSDSEKIGSYSLVSLLKLT